MSWRREFAATWALMVALTILGLIVSMAVVGGALGSSGVLPTSTRDETFGLRQLMLALVLAPLLEEALWRGWLSGRGAALRFAAYGLAALALLLSGFLAAPDIRKTLALVAAGVVFAGLVHWSLTRHRDREVPPWFPQHFHWLVWGSSLTFGLVHLGNFEPLSHPLGALVVAPLMLGGMLLAYTRTRLGLRAAMAHHAAYNAVLVGTVWAFG